MNSLQRASGKSRVLFGRLREFFRRKRQGLWLDKWILHHDSDTANDALRVRELVAKNSITRTDQPPYLLT